MMDHTASAAHGPDAHPGWVTVLLCAAAAVMFGLALPPFDLWPLVLTSPLLLGVAALGAKSSRRVILLTWATQWVLWFWLQRWLFDVTPVGWPLLAGYLALYPSLFVWGLRRLHHQRVFGRRVPIVVLVPLLWTATEYFRAAVFMDGYPWFLLGQPLVQWPVLVQSVDLFGAYGATVLGAMVAGAGLEAVAAALGMVEVSRRTVLIRLIAVLLVLAGNLAYGLVRLGQTGPLRPGPVILAIQTNLPQSNKKAWDRAQQLKDVPEFVRHTIEVANRVGADADLIVWPETMVPGHGFDPQALQFQVEGGHWPGRWWLDSLQELRAAMGDRPLLVGSPTRIGLGIDEAGTSWTWDSSFNSAYLLDRPEPPFQRYDKVFLTPFGETMPYISEWAWLESQLLALGAGGMSFNLDASDEPRVLRLEANGVEIGLATPICFEDTVNGVCRDLVWSNGHKRAEIIINLSNDGWFGDYSEGRLQHAQLARFRCIENRVPMVRAANTGLSVHIDSNGKVIGVAGEGRNNGVHVADWVLARTMLDDRVTLFSRIGNLLPNLILATAGFLIVTTFRWPRAFRGD